MTDDVKLNFINYFDMTVSAAVAFTMFLTSEGYPVVVLFATASE